MSATEMIGGMHALLSTLSLMAEKGRERVRGVGQEQHIREPRGICLLAKRGAREDSVVREEGREGIENDKYTTR